MNLFQSISRTVLGLTIVCLIALTACTAVSEEPATEAVEVATAAPTRDSGQQEATAVPEAEQTQPEPTPVPSDTPAAEPTLVPTPEIQSEASTIATSNEVQFSLENQWGGTFHTVAMVDNIAFAGVGPRLLAIDISNPDQAVQLGQSELLPDNVQAVVIENNIATVANGRGGVAQFDVSDPAQMRLIGQINEFGDIPSRVNSVAVAEDLIFATTYESQTGQGFLVIIDSSDPANLQFQESQPLTNISRVYEHQNVLYLLGYDNLQTFSPESISQPLGTLGFGGGSWQPVLLFQDNTAFLNPVMPSGLHVLDVTNPAQIEIIGQAADDGVFRMGGIAAAAGQTFYMTGTFGEFGFCGSSVSIFDISDPANPEAVNEFDPKNCINGLAVAGNTLLAVGRSGMQLYDLQSADNPVLRSTFVPVVGLQDVQSIAVDGRTYYTSSAQGQGALLEVFDASEPDVISRFGEPFNLEAGFINSAYIYNLTYVAPVWQDGLRLVKVNNPAAPSLDGRITGEEMQMGDMLVSAIYNGYLYLPVHGREGSSIGVIDIRDAANPQIVNEVKAVYPLIMEIVEADGRLYVLNQEANNLVQIFDLSDPANPVELGQVVLPQTYSRLAVVGDMLYAACDIWNCRHLAIVNVADPGQAALVKEVEMPLGVIKMMPADEQTIILAVNGDGLYALDITNPVEPVLAGHQPIAGEYYNLAIQDSEIVVAAQNAGLYQIQLDR